jgi:hypothetical protein
LVDTLIFKFGEFKTWKMKRGPELDPLNTSIPNLPQTFFFTIYTWHVLISAFRLFQFKHLPPKMKNKLQIFPKEKKSLNLKIETNFFTKIESIIILKWVWNQTVGPFVVKKLFGGWRLLVSRKQLSPFQNNYR